MVGRHIYRIRLHRVGHVCRGLGRIEPVAVPPHRRPRAAVARHRRRRSASAPVPCAPRRVPVPQRPTIRAANRRRGAGGHGDHSQP